MPDTERCPRCDAILEDGECDRCVEDDPEPDYSHTRNDPLCWGNI